MACESVDQAYDKNVIQSMLTFVVGLLHLHDTSRNINGLFMHNFSIHFLLIFALDLFSLEYGVTK